MLVTYFAIHFLKSPLAGDLAPEVEALDGKTVPNSTASSDGFDGGRVLLEVASNEVLCMFHLLVQRLLDYLKMLDKQTNL